MEERKMPASSVEKEMQERNRSFDVRHFESYSPSGTTQGPGEALWEEAHLQLPLPLDFAHVVA